MAVKQSGCFCATRGHNYLLLLSQVRLYETMTDAFSRWHSSLIDMIMTLPGFHLLLVGLESVK